MPKLDVVAALAEAAGEGRITAPNHEWVGRALASFDPAVRGEADDVVYAIACAIWWSRTRMRSQIRQPPAPRLPLPEPRKMTFDDALTISRREGQKRRDRI